MPNRNTFVRPLKADSEPVGLTSSLRSRLVPTHKLRLSGGKIGASTPVMAMGAVVVQPNGFVDVTLKRLIPADTETGALSMEPDPSTFPRRNTFVSPERAVRFPPKPLRFAGSMVVPTHKLRLSAGNVGPFIPVTVTGVVAVQPNGVVDVTLNRFTPALTLIGALRIEPEPRIFPRRNIFVRPDRAVKLPPNPLRLVGSMVVPTHKLRLSGGRVNAGLTVIVTGQLPRTEPTMGTTTVAR